MMTKEEMSMTGRSSGDVIGPIPTISPQHAEVFFFVFGAIAVLVVLAAIAESVRRRSPLMLICLIGSVLCNPVEPIWDALGKLRFHHGNYWAWTEFPDLAQPVQYPWWAAFVYTFFTGVTCYVFFRMFENRVKWSTYWLFVAGQAVMNIVLEGYVITSAYDYYGDQPWRIGSDFPLWWVFANFGELLGGALLALAVRRFGRRGYPLAIVLVPSSFAAWELWAGWPVFATLNMSVGPVWRDVAAVLTAAIAVGTIWVIGRLMLPAEQRVAALPEQRPIPSGATVDS
jgi:hypothetical protein